jgi:predicted phosphodiesterase
MTKVCSLCGNPGEFRPNRNQCRDCENLNKRRARLNNKLEPILIISDTHRPYHDVKAWGLMLQVGQKLQPKHLITIGDFVDFFSVSSHSKNPTRKSQLQDEIDDALNGLDELDGLGASNKIYIGGNHEDRLTRYLQDKAPELFNVVRIPDLLSLESRGWKYIPYKSHVKIGKLHLTHDVGAAGRSATFKALDTYQHSIITGHAHRLQYIVEGNAVGEFKLSAQFGWLGDSNQIDYLSRATVNKNWALGFGAGYINPDDGIAYINPIPIINYTCVWNGELFTA